jgi:hypothetical protein
MLNEAAVLKRVVKIARLLINDDILTMNPDSRKIKEIRRSSRRVCVQLQESERVGYFIGLLRRTPRGDFNMNISH